MIQVNLTPAAGKRLIAKAVVSHPELKNILEVGIITIVAGTTNGYVAEEILKKIGQLEGFSRDSFFRGITTSPFNRLSKKEKKYYDNSFLGDVVIVKGEWKKGLTLFDITAKMKEGDIILKGANAINLISNQAGVLIGVKEGGTIIEIMRNVVGKRVKLIIPVGLEKRVSCDLSQISLKLNSPKSEGLRLMPVQGEIITEIEAISILSGASAKLFAAGGVNGAEGSIWLTITGKPKEEKVAEKIIKNLIKEPPFII